MRYLFISIILYILAFIFLYLFQNKLMYFPNKNTTNEFKNIIVKNDNEKINVLVGNEGKENAIFYFGGNAEIASYTIKTISKEFPEYTVYCIDYRGFGKSSGVPSEKGLFSDALKIYDTLSKQHKNNIIVGRSLGTGIAAYLASNRDIFKLILITPYYSVLSIAQERYFMFPVSIALKDKYETYKYVKNIQSPILILIAEKDTVIPEENTNKLIDSLKNKTITVKSFPDRNHFDISQDEDYLPTMRNFIKL